MSVPSWMGPMGNPLGDGPDTYMGFKLVANVHMREQFRFPRTKKKRTRAKWMHRPENYRQVRNKAFRVGNTIYAHPEMIMRLRQGTVKLPI